MAADLSALEAEIREAVACGGFRPRHLVLVSTFGERKGMRYAYRVESDDGRIVKARHFGTAAAAQRVHVLRRGIEDSFAPVLGCFGPVLLESWLEGEMLPETEAEQWAQAAGAILGRLHGHRLEVDGSAEDETTRWNRVAATDVDLLRRAGVLSAAGGEALCAALRRHDPGRVRVALIHRDFCAENMLIDPAGRLRIIDTEILGIGPIGLDLAWTWHRWPMSAEAWGRFMAGYRSAAPAAPEALAYWKIAAGLTLVRIFFQRMPSRLDAQLARLHQCVAAAEGEHRSEQ